MRFYNSTKVTQVIGLMDYLVEMIEESSGFSKSINRS